MKKLLIIVITFLSTNYIIAQIKVNPNNTVRVGDISNSNSQTVDFQVTHDSYFNCLPASSGIKINAFQIGSASVPMVEPQWGNSAFLGGSGLNFWSVYSYNINYQNLLKFSDQRFKTNISELSQGINDIKLLNPVTYDTEMGIDSTTPEPRKSELIDNQKNQMGFLAQEVQTIFPNLVFYNVEADKYMLDYTGLIPVLVKAIQEQQTKIEELEAEIDLLKEQ